MTNSGPRNFLVDITLTDSVDSTEMISPDEISLVFLDHHPGHNPVSPHPPPLARDVFTNQFIKLLQALIIFLLQFLISTYLVKSLQIPATNVLPLLSALPCEIPLIIL